MRTKLLILLLLVSLHLFSEEVKVSIVGYTLLDDFKIICSRDSVVKLDGKIVPYSSFTISSSGTLISGDREYIFTTLEILSEGITTLFSHYGEQPYLGDFIITYDNRLTIINRVDKLDYLASVLGSEMGSPFDKEALKAQLLCIKNYYSQSKLRNSSKPWDILNTASVMAYRGYAYSSSYMKSIVRELQEVDLNLREGIEPLFFSTAAGYLLNQECFTSTLDNPPVDPVIKKHNNLSSPYYNFDHTVSSDELLKLIKSSVPIESLERVVLKKFKGSECIDFIGFVDKNSNTYWLKGYSFVSLMQKKYGSLFKSIQFELYKENEYYHFTGRGFGHFVGMSQYGAQEMALNGSSYIDILQYYFPLSSID